MTALPDTLWFVVTDYQNLGLGSGDCCTTELDADNQFTDAVEAGRRVCVLRVHVGDCGTYGAHDVTDDFEDVLHERCIARGRERPEVKRFTPASVAAAMAVEDDLPTWDDIRGRAPDATGGLSSEDFVRGLRDAWR